MKIIPQTHHWKRLDSSLNLDTKGSDTENPENNIISWMENVILWLFLFLCWENKLHFPSALIKPKPQLVFFCLICWAQGGNDDLCITALNIRIRTIFEANQRAYVCNTTASVPAPLMGHFIGFQISNAIFFPVTQELSHTSEPSPLHLRTQFAEICEQSIKQTDRFPGWKTTKEKSPSKHGARQQPLKPLWYLIPHIVGEQSHVLPACWPDWHGRQPVSGGDEEFHHEHTWLRNGVWSLHAFFARALAGPFWWPRSLSPPLMVRNRAKYF